MSLVAQGYTNREIAEKLTVSIRTVEGHQYRALVPVERAENAWRAIGPAARRVCTTAAGLRAAARISAATGAKVLVETFPARLARGSGVPDIHASATLPNRRRNSSVGTRHLILVGARSPVTFFAYPDMRSDLVPKGAEVHSLADGRTGGHRRATRCARGPPRRRPARYRATDGAAELRQLGRGHRGCSCRRTRSSLTKPTRAACCCPLRPPRRRRTMYSP